MLTIRPCIPRCLAGFSLATLRHEAAHYDIVIDNFAPVATGMSHIVVDNVRLDPGACMPRLVDEGQRHQVSLGIAQPVLP